MPSHELRIEINDDPGNVGFSGMTEKQIYDHFHAKTVSVNRETMSASEVLNTFDDAEFQALSELNSKIVWSVLDMVTLNPFGAEFTILERIFGSTSKSIVELKAARVEKTTPIVAKQLGNVTLGSIARAKEKGTSTGRVGMRS